MPNSIYAFRVVHIFAILLVLCGLSAAWGICSQGPINRQQRRALAIIHGLGLTAILVSGIALASQLGIPMAPPPPWLITKAAIWLALGASLAVARQKVQWGIPLLLAWVALGTLAAYMAIFKPI